jgi:hypothetical protein
LSLSITLQLLRYWSLKRAGFYQPHLCLSRLLLVNFAQTQLPMSLLRHRHVRPASFPAPVSDAEASLLDCNRSALLGEIWLVV